jgi:hypothetical protein
MGLNLILVLAGIAAAWVVLSALGNERQRRVQEADSVARNAAPSTPPSIKSAAIAGAKAVTAWPAEKSAH